jgi:hypothetical protein
VIERAIFLHENDDVLDVAQCPCSAVGGDGKRSANGRRERQGQRGASRGGHTAQEITSIASGHVNASFVARNER